MLACRLSRQFKVVLVEAGPADRSLLIRMPAAININLRGRRFDWRYESAPQEALGGRRIAQPRGRVLGGSSSPNGMIFVRGHAYD